MHSLGPVLRPYKLPRCLQSVRCFPTSHSAFCGLCGVSEYLNGNQVAGVRQTINDSGRFSTLPHPADRCGGLVQTAVDQLGQ